MTKKAVKPKAPAAHPPYIAMVKAAIAALKVRNDQKPVNSRVKMALRNGSAKGVLKHHGKGAGANGSFKVAEKAAKATKKTAAAKPKKAKSPKKKPNGLMAKKPAAKKASPKKKTAAKKT